VKDAEHEVTWDMELRETGSDAGFVFLVFRRKPVLWVTGRMSHQ
jgi:hypothetical protein